MSVGEAIRLVRILQRDTSSQIAAALQGWEFPFDRTTAALLDLFDLEHAKAAKKPKPHPGRPFALNDARRERHGNAAGRSRDEVLALLDRHRGKPTPTPEPLKEAANV